MKLQRTATIIYLFTFVFIDLAWSYGERHEIPLVIQGRHKLPKSFYPIPLRCGIPFPEKIYYEKKHDLQLLNSKNKRVEFQSRVTSFWDSKRKKGVRWILLNFLAEKEGGYRLVLKKKKYQLKRNKKKNIIFEQNGRFIINTGQLKAECKKNRLNILSNIRLIKKTKISKIINSKEWAGPYIEHEKNGFFHAFNDKNVKIEVEENGPIHAVLKAEGWYKNDQNERFCKFLFRFHFYKGKDHIKLEHTFIYTGNSQDDKIRDIGIKIPLKGKVLSAGSNFGTLVKEGFSETVHVSNKLNHVYQVMDSPDHQRMEWILKDGENDKILFNGEKASGWMNTCTPHSRMTVVLKDAWQQYPFEFERIGSNNFIHLWPKHGRVLDTSFHGYWYFLTDQQKVHQLKSFSWFAKHRSKSPEEIEKVMGIIFDQWYNTQATGFAKTHELGIFFNNVRHWNIGNLNCFDYVNKEVFCHADLKWQTKTRALDWVQHQPKDLKLFKEEEFHLSSMLKMVEMNRDFTHMYGWFDWGGYYGQHLPLYPENKRYGASTFSNTHYMPRWHRSKPKSHYYWGSLPWQMYFRTGERKWLSYAKTYTLYALDRSFCHITDPQTGRIAGAEYHYDNSHMHWEAGVNSPGPARHAGVMDRNDAVYQYWLTGDRRPLDTLFAWGKQFLDYMKKGSQIKSFLKEHPWGDIGRNLGQILNKLTILYEVTLDEKYLTAATKIADRFKNIDVTRAESSSKKEMNAYYHLHSAWIYEGLYRYYCVTGDKEIKASLVQYCQRASDLGTGFLSGGLESGSLNSFAYGYLLTKDPLYLDLGRRIIDREIYSGVSREAFTAGGRKFRNTSMPRFLGVMTNNAPKSWQENNLPTHERGHSLDLRTYENSSLKDSKNIYFFEEKDQDFSIHFAALRTGVFAIFDPKGNIVAKTKPSSVHMHRYTIKVRKDGKTGTYTLRQIEDNSILGKRMYACINIISSDLKKIVYDGYVKFIEDGETPFQGRKWFIGIPANSKNAKVQWVPNRFEAFHRNFKIVSEDHSYSYNTKDMLEDYESDYGFYTFKFPVKNQLEIYECSPVYEDNLVLKYVMPSFIGGQFRIFNAPPYVASSKESYFIPKKPEKYNY